MYSSLKFMKINITEFIESVKSIEPRRIATIMRKLARASVMDSWDWQDGNYELTSGDKLFKPKTPIEDKFWKSLRAQQKEDYRAYTKSIAGGAKGGRPKETLKPETPKKDAGALVKKLGFNLNANRNGVYVYQDFDIRGLDSKFDEFARRKFSPPTIFKLNSWLVKNWLNKTVKIETMLKTGCAIQKLNYDTVILEYLNFC